MIKVLKEPELTIKGGFSTLDLCVCEGFDDDYSVRGLIASIVAALQTKASVELTLDPEEPLEYFVNGILRWQSTSYEIFFDRTFGYLSFSSSAESGARELLDSLVQELAW
jgi:hypothetical protein